MPLAILLVIGFRLLYTCAPLTQALFHSAALDADTWLRSLSIALSVYVMVEVEKGLVRRLKLPVG